jgi:hypothetical protein
VFLLLQSLDILNEFFSGLGNTTLGDLIFNLKGNAGNKNIMAATLVMKIPFAAYCIYSLKTFGKIANILILALGTLAVFFINARASYLSLILVSILYIAYCVYEYFQHKSLADLGKRIGLFFVPIIITFALSNLIIDNQLQLETKESSYGYGSVTERLGTISFTKEGSNLRMYQWLSAVDYIKKHPAMGAGFGNWKLVSIPYEKTFSDEMYITYHVHNDFLETTAELGWFGGLLYLGLYVLMLVMTLKVVFSDASRDNKQMSVFGLMALSVYFIDAMFNFPLERPIMQVFLAFIMAVHVTSYLAARKESGKPLNVGWAAPAFAAIALVLAMFTYFYNHQTYKSMVAQNLYNADMLTANPVRKSYEVIPALPDIPNLNVFGFPIDAIKARYLLAEKKYDESLAYLNKSANVNPYISYNEFLKGNLFMETQKWDSALYYAKKCFYMKPRAKSNYQLYNAVLAHYKDSTEARKAFEEVTKYRKEPWIWNDYVSILYMCGKDYKTLFQIADQGAKMFPNDVELKKKQKDLGAIQNQPR